MLRKSFINISLVSFGNVFNTVLGFIFLTAIARSLSLEDFGRYSLLISLLTFISKGTDFGTNSLFIAKSIASEDKSIISTFYSLKLILLVLLMPLSVIILSFLKISDPLLILVFLLGLIAYAVNFTIYSLYQKKEQYLMLILVNSVLAIIKFVFAVLIFLNLFKPTLLSSFTIFSLCIYPSLLLIFFLPKEFLNFKFSLKKVKNFFIEAIPAGTSLLVANGWAAIANTITSFFTSFSNVGIYSLADKLSQIFSLISFSIFTVLLPKNAKRKKEHKEFDFKETFIISMGLLLLAFIGAFVSNFVVVPVFGSQFKESLPILYVLLFSSSFTAINTFMENYFFVENKTKQLLPITITRLFTFIFFVFTLMPKYSINGMAYANLISSITVTLLILVLIKTHKVTVK